MEYTVDKLARIADVSGRTLRYYDEICLLKPARINSSGYRIYGAKEVDKLQQILFYRELGLDLKSIKDIINSPKFNEVNTLSQHRERLMKKREQLDILINNIDKTIESKKGSIIMKDKEKFQGFKEKLISENEEKYGREAREKYGDKAVNKSNKKLKNMTKEEYDEVTKLSADILETLNEAYKTGDPAGELGQKVADMHRRWLSFYWGSYSAHAHAGLAKMYVEDERFKAYYDKNQPGLAEFLRDAILIYTGVK